MKYFPYILFLFSLLSFGQNQKKIDSLEKVIQNTKNTDIINTCYTKLIDLAFDFDLNKANQYIKKLEQNNKNSSNYDAHILYLKGLSSCFNGDYKNSIILLDSSANKFKKMDSLIGYRKSFIEASSIMMDLNKVKEAKFRLLNIIKEINSSKNKAQLPKAYFRLADAYGYLNKNSLAIKNYIIADSLLNLPKFTNLKLKAGICYNLAQIFRTNKEYKKSIHYLNEGEKLAIITKDSFGLMLLKFNKGVVFVEQNKPDKSIKIFKESYNYFKDVDQYQIGAISLYFGLAYRLKNESAVSNNYLKKAITYFDTDSITSSKIYTNIAANYISLNKLKLAKKTLTKNKKILINLQESTYKYQYNKVLKDFYKKNKLYKLGLQTNEENIILKDLIDKRQNDKKARELETKYQTKKKEQEITLLTAQNKLNLTQKKNQRNLLIGGLVLTSLTGLFFFFQFRNRQKTTKKLRELDTAKSNFFTNISHEFRTPLTLISGPIQKQLKKENLPKEERSNLLMMQRNSNRLLSLVDQLLDISKLESGSLKLKVSNSKITPFIGNLIDGFLFKAKQKNINLIINTNKTTNSTWIDKDAIEKMVTNLLSNAIKYTPEKGTIICNSFIKDNKLVFEIKNSGKGLTKEELKKVFKRFYQIDNDTEGVGIGLALVKELVTLHKGNITVVSNLNEWTTFKIVLPINKASFKEDEIVLKTANLEQDFIKQENTSITENKKSTDLNSEKPILLIVEDNTDVRTYVSSIFSETHSIIQAKNGQEGIDLAIEHIPDIIISDIMMPIKDGIALCNTLKVDERTSHIPIILLTAKAGEENEIEGVKTGADDYITKPFNEDLLLLKVNKLIEVRKKLQERYSQEVVLRPKDIAISSVDENFLNRVQAILDDNLIESSFNIKDFSKSVGMSRMQLHRKLKALTGLSASEFIRSQRLKLAAQLLEKSDINVSQIGYSVGFNDHAYFSKCFKEVYNCTPTEYANSKN